METEAAIERLRAEERRIRAALAAAEADGAARGTEWRGRLERAEDAVERERQAFRKAGGEA